MTAKKTLRFEVIAEEAYPIYKIIPISPNMEGSPDLKPIEMPASLTRRCAALWQEIMSCAAAVEEYLDRNDVHPGQLEAPYRVRAQTPDNERCPTRSTGRYNARCELRQNHEGKHRNALIGKF